MFNRQSTIENRQSIGFTLVELLVVIAIISLLVSILLPSLSKAKELARRAVCMSQLKHIGTAFVMYTGDENDYLPPVYLSYGDKWSNSLANPYLDYHQTGTPLGDELRLNVSIFTCPTHFGLHPETLSQLTYGMNWYAGHNTDIKKITDVEVPTETSLAGDGHYRSSGPFWVASIAPPYGATEEPFPEPVHSEGDNFLHMGLNVGWMSWDDIPYDPDSSEGEQFWQGK